MAMVDPMWRYACRPPIPWPSFRATARRASEPLPIFRCRLPLRLSTADLNKDGYRDIVASNNGSANLSVFLNNASPNVTFAAPVTYAAGNGARGLALFDFNKDGNVDIAVANQDARTVQLLFGSGNGTFAAASGNYDVSGGASCYVVALLAVDANGDGNMDLVTTSSVPNNLRVLVNNGAGIFAAPVAYPAGTNVYYTDAGDLNGDGRQDLVVTNFASNTVSVLLNAGGGAFATAVNYNVGTGPAGCVVRDINGDGKLDVVTANQTDNSLSVLLGQGNGTLSTATPVAAGLRLPSLRRRDVAALPPPFFAYALIFILASRALILCLPLSGRIKRFMLLRKQSRCLGMSPRLVLQLQ